MAKIRYGKISQEKAVEIPLNSALFMVVLKIYLIFFVFSKENISDSSWVSIPLNNGFIHMFSAYQVKNENIYKMKKNQTRYFLITKIHFFILGYSWITKIHSYFGNCKAQIQRQVGLYFRYFFH